MVKEFGGVKGQMGHRTQSSSNTSGRRKVYIMMKKKQKVVNVNKVFSHPRTSCPRTL